MNSVIWTVLYELCYIWTMLYEQCYMIIEQCYMNCVIWTVLYEQCYMNNVIWTVLYEQCYMNCVSECACLLLCKDSKAYFCSYVLLCLKILQSSWTWNRHLDYWNDGSNVVILNLYPCTDLVFNQTVRFMSFDRHFILQTEA